MRLSLNWLLLLTHRPVIREFVGYQGPDRSCCERLTGGASGHGFSRRLSVLHEELQRIATLAAFFITASCLKGTCQRPLAARSAPNRAA
jgi:hypothetical protein